MLFCIKPHIQGQVLSCKHSNHAIRTFMGWVTKVRDGLTPHSIIDRGDPRHFSYIHFANTNPLTERKKPQFVESTDDVQSYVLLAGAKEMQEAKDVLSTLASREVFVEAVRAVRCRVLE